KVLPLLLLDGRRNTLTRPSSSSQRSCRLLGMSLQTRYRPCPFQAGPSHHSAPVHSRWMGALGCARPLKLGSTAMTSGSQKYVFGAPFGPKSRGGVVTVLGGATGPAGACACAAAAPIARVPVQALSA